MSVRDVRLLMVDGVERLCERVSGAESSHNPAPWDVCLGTPTSGNAYYRIIDTTDGSKPTAPRSEERLYLALSFMLTDRAKCERIIAGSIKSAIAAHGPITDQTRASAAKRVYSQLLSAAKDVNP